LRFAETVRRNKELTAANDSLKRANQQLEKGRHHLEEKTARLQDQIASVEEELRAKREELEATTRSLRQTEQTLHQVQQALHTLETTLNATEGKLTQTQSKLKDTQAKLAATEKELERTQTSAVNVGKEFVNLSKQLVELEKQRDALEAKRQKLYEEIQEIIEWKNVGMKVVRGKITIGANEVIASRTLPAGLTPEAARRELEQLLQEANRVAEEHGAKASEEQPRPLILATREVIVGGVRELIHEDQILRNTAEDIARRQKSFVVDAVAWRNYVEGEPVQAQLVLYPNQMVFSQGDQIFAKEVRGLQSKAGLFHDITRLLEEAQLVAAQQGVVPRKKYAYEEGTNEKIFDLLERLESQRGRAQVRVIAAKNLWTADQLSVRFEVSQ